MRSLKITGGELRSTPVSPRRVGAVLFVALLATAGPLFAQSQEIDPVKRRNRLEQVQQQIREDIRQRSQQLYAATLSQTYDDASFRRQESELLSLRSQEGEVQRLLVKTEMQAIEANIKLQVCPEAAPDKQVLVAELKIADAQKRFLSDRLDEIHRSMNLCLERMKSRGENLEARQAEIDDLRAKERRIAAELEKLPAATTTASVK